MLTPAPKSGKRAALSEGLLASPVRSICSATTSCLRVSENEPSRDCLETPNGLRFVVPRARTRGRNGAIFGASHYRGKRDPTRLDTFQTVSLLDFSHLRAKGLEIRSSSQCATSADQGAYPPPTDHNDAVYGPSPHFPRRTPLPIPPGLLSVGRLFACRCGRPTCKNSQGPS